MAQPKRETNKKPKSPREIQVTKLAENLRKDSKTNAKHITYIGFGSDKNKTKKNDLPCGRGTASGPARYCSAHLREIYPLDIIQDNHKTEFCVEGRHNKECCNNNPCRLCKININSNDYIKLPIINFAKALCDDLRCHADNTNLDRYNRALQSFVTSHITSDYPGTNNENTILRIKVDGKIWLEYFIKLTAFSSLLKTSAPSGYKYKDRISIGRTIKVQNNSNRDLVFFIVKDPLYNDPEKEEERPVVNGVGFWNLLKPATEENEIRNIIQLNEDQSIHVSFGFLIRPHCNVNKIEVELECTRKSMSMDKTAIPLWSWSAFSEDNNSMSPFDHVEHKSNGSGSPTISSHSVRSASPINHANYPTPISSISSISSIPSIPSIPTISNNPTIPTIPTMISQSIPPQNQVNNTQFQPGYDHWNNYQQPLLNNNFNDDGDNISYIYNIADNRNNNYQNNNPQHQYRAYHDATYNRIRYDPYYRPIQPVNAPNFDMELPPIIPAIEPSNDRSLNMNNNQLIQGMEQDNYNQNGFEFGPDLISTPSIINDNFALNEPIAPRSFFDLNNHLLNNPGFLDNESIFINN